MPVIDNLLEESAHHWGITAKQGKWIFWLPVIATGGVLALGLSRDVFRWLLQEDGPVEWLTTIAFAGAAIVAGKIVIQRLSANRLWQALLFVLVALAMVYAAGEEISWGQRIFGWETPEALAEINDQGETTLHNIGGLLDISNIALLLIGFYGSVAYLANRKLQVERYWDKADYLFVPPFFLATFFLPIFVFRLLRLTVFTEATFAVNRLSEWNEAIVAIGILGFLWLANLHVTSAVRTEATPRAPQERA